MKDLISVIIPIYNVEKYLNKCLDSIINQTYTNIEIILINDGSTDNCGKICESYKKIDNRIVVIHSKNKGVSSARNIGLEISKGKYILFVDSDDWLERDMIKELYNNLIKTKSQISICNYYEIVNGNKYSNDLNVKESFNTEQFIEYTFDENYFRGYLWNKLFSRNIIFDENSKFIKFDENIHICEDLLFNFKVAQNTNKICYIDKKLYNYLQRENSALSSEFSLKEASRLIAFKELIKIASKYNNTLDKTITFEYVRASMDIKYKMHKYKLLNYEIRKSLNLIRNKNILYGLKSKDHKFSDKFKLVINSISCYLYGRLKDRKS